MRYSESHKQETHAKLVKIAARMLREKGPDGFAVAELMNEAGLTHGGFYAHFESKEACVAEALARNLRAIGAPHAEKHRRPAAAPRARDRHRPLRLAVSSRQCGRRLSGDKPQFRHAAPAASRARSVRRRRESDGGDG